jgi:hypothetical protein
LSPEPIRVSLVLSGAVALGSFEAGVVCELLEAVSAGAPVTIDVIAGSSAGSLVGAQAAKSLVMGVPFRPMLRRWTEVTLHELTVNYEAPDQAELRRKPIDAGILSTEAVREILVEHLVSDPVSRTFQPAHPAGRVVLLMTLTNLDGLPGSGQDGDEVRFSDAVTFTFRVPVPYDLKRTSYPPAIWERVALCGLASSAFPGAFDPQYVPWRDRLRVAGLVTEEWENDHLLSRLDQAEPEVQPRMRYCDGGIMDEQPIDRAIAALVRVTDPGGSNGPERLVYDPRRVFLLIEPDPPVTSLEAVKAGLQATWLATFSRAIRLWSLSSAPHSSQWRLRSANARQVRLLEFLADLATQMREERARVAEVAAAAAAAFLELNDPNAAQHGAPGLIAPESFADAIRSFYLWLEDDSRFLTDMEWLDRRSAVRFGGPHREVRGALLRLRAAFVALYGLDPEAPRYYQEVLAEVHLNLAESLGLTQPWVLLHTITPEDPKTLLRGEEAIHFGGFFDQRFLEHDFQAGRYYARAWLQDSVPSWQPDDEVTTPQPSPEGITWGTLWRNRRPLRRMAGRSVQALLEAAGLRMGGAGQLLVRLAGWSFLLAALHAILVTGAVLSGWIELPSDIQGGRFWVLLASSLFPLLLGLLIGLLIGTAGVRLSLRWLPSVQGRRFLNLFFGRKRQ